MREKQEQAFFQLNNYKKQIEKNMNDEIEIGERHLAKELCSCIKKNILNNLTVYYQLSYEHNHKVKKIDFLLVSTNAIIIIESKNWQGSTYFYHQMNSLFDNSVINTDFGLYDSQTISIRVFNVKHGVKARELTVQAYQNPVRQIRRYTRDFVEKLDIQPIHNVVVMSSMSDCEIQVDEDNLTTYEIDNYTTLVTDLYLEEYLSRFTENQFSNEDLTIVHDKIARNCQYQFKLESSNVNEAPFLWL